MKRRRKRSLRQMMTRMMTITLTTRLKSRLTAGREVTQSRTWLNKKMSHRQSKILLTMKTIPAVMMMMVVLKSSNKCLLQWSLTSRKLPTILASIRVSCFPNSSPPRPSHQLPVSKFHFSGAIIIKPQQPMTRSLSWRLNWMSKMTMRRPSLIK